MRGKRTAKNVATATAKEEDEYSVDEIATLLTGAKRRGKKAAVPIADENVTEEVIDLPAPKPRGRGKKFVAQVETALENQGDANVTHAKRGRAKKGPPVTADDEPQENRDVVTTEIDIVPRTSSRRVQKVIGVIEAQAENGNEVSVPVPVPVKAKKGRGKKVTETTENDESVKATTRRGKTPVNEITKGTKKAKKEDKPELEDIVEEKKPARRPAPKRYNKKIDVNVEDPLGAKPTKVRGDKNPTAAEISKSMTTTKSKGKKKIVQPVEDVPTHITADEESVPQVTEKKSRKRGAAKEDEEAVSVKKVLKNATVTNYNNDAFATKKKHSLKISTWNVAGMRSWLKKDGLKFLEYEQPDIFCLQEIKCEDEQLPKEAVNVAGYHRYWLCMPGGYAGVAIYSRIMPIHVEYGIGEEEFDKNGRIITAEYEKFYLINVYVPNSGRKLVNLEKRMDWEELFLAHVQRFDKQKPVIICGDMNVSHQEIDLANPKSNTRNAGFTAEERDKMTQLLAAGFVDTFRHLYPKKTGAYTFWSYMGNARKRNIGWRLDYFLTSQRILSRVVDQELRTNVLGSDHCPSTLLLNI